MAKHIHIHVGRGKTGDILTVEQAQHIKRINLLRGKEIREINDWYSKEYAALQKEKDRRESESIKRRTMSLAALGIQA